VSNALTVAQAAAVREARLAVLDHLRGRLQNRAVQLSPARRPDPEHRFLFPALDLGAAGDGHCASELAFLSPLAGQPGSALDQWEQELAGVEGENPTAGRTWDFLLRYGRVVDVEAPAAVTFLATYRQLTERVLNGAPPADLAQAEDRERVRRWADDHQALADRLACGPRFIDVFQDFIHGLKDKLLTPWDRALRGRYLLLFQRQTVRMPLSRSERSAIRNDEPAAALERLSNAVRGAIAARGQRAADFAGALARWRASVAGRSWLDAVLRLETEALQQRHVLEGQSALWDQCWSWAEDRLGRWLETVHAVLANYEPLLSANGGPDEVNARLTRAQREALDVRGAEEAVSWLQTNWPAPSERIEAVFALWELGLGAL
jgi:hypothetical protein